MKKLTQIRNHLTLAAQEGFKGLLHGEGGPFGAVITLKGRVIAKGHNTVIQTNDPTAHAEINALRLASTFLKKHHLVGCQIFSSTEPCAMCASAIHWARLNSVYFSSTMREVKKLGFNELDIPIQAIYHRGKSPVRLSRVKTPACDFLLNYWRILPERPIY